MDDNAAQVAPGRLLALIFTVGIVLGLMAVFLWITVADGSDNDAAPQASSSSRPSEQEQQPNPDPRPSPGAADTRRERCAEAARALEAPLKAARPALEQWHVHVDAMNQLVVGEITLQQATRFWNQTRLGARHHLERFRREWSELQRTGVDCPAPGFLGPAPATARSCSRVVDAELRVARSAKTAIDTWDTHVRDMDMLRMGVLSPDRATEMWLRMWKQGVRDLDAYRMAARNPVLDLECDTQR
jgi:hypothetical protein